MTAIPLRRGVLVAVAALALLAAPAGATTDRTDAACGAAGTEKAFRAYVSAFNHGEFGQLDELFATWPAFGWYSSNSPGRRINDAAITRDTLLAYFRARHRVDDRLRVVWFRFNSRAHGHAHFGFGLRRSAADYRGGEWFELVGKGALQCSDGRFVVLSLGGPALGGPDTTTR